MACVRAAPAKDFPNPVRLDVERVAPLVHSAFGEFFAPEFEASDSKVVVRYRPRDPDLGGGEWYLQVWPDGLIEATVPTAHTVTDSGELHIPLLEVARILGPAIEALRCGGYEEAFGPNAELPLGLDWEIKVSRQLVDDTSTTWDALAFPGTPKRSTGQGPPWTSPGFGHDQLLCVPTTTTVEDILMPAFADLLDRSGYYGTDDALDDLRAAIRQLGS